MAVNLSPVFNDQTFDSAGDPASGYKLFTYVAGSTTKQTTYSDRAGTTPQSNPIIINSLGYPTAGPIWLTSGETYKFVLASQTDTDPPLSPIKTIDGVTGVNDVSSPTYSQWSASGVTPTYIGASSFSMVGDQTSAFHVGRRLQFTTSGGTVYGTIKTSVFGAVTTVTMAMDGVSVLDAGLSVVNMSILRNDQIAFPVTQLGSIKTVASATTPDIFGTGGSMIDYTGTATCTGFVSAIQAGQECVLVCAGAAIFTAGANMLIDGIASGSNYTAQAGDKVIVRAVTTTQFRLTIEPYFWPKQIQPITATITGGNAITVVPGFLSLDFRNTTLTTGTVSFVSGTPANLVIGSTDSFGLTTVFGNQRLAILAINNAGTIELAATALYGGVSLDETGVITTITNPTLKTDIKSTNARTGLAYRVIGFVDATYTSGTPAWGSITLVQGAGGNAATAFGSIGYGQTWQDVTGSRVLGTTYYNTTGKPIQVDISCSYGGATNTLTINGIATGLIGGPVTTYVSRLHIIPPGNSYVVSAAGTLNKWLELR